jgi:cytochrome P450
VQRDPLGLFTRAWRDHGDYVRLRVCPGLTFYLLTHPEAVEQVLHKNYKNYRKPRRFTAALALLAGNGLLSSSGESWLRQRRLAQPAFHRHHLDQLAPLVVGAAEHFLQDRHAEGPGHSVDIFEHMLQLALGIAATTLFGGDLTGEAALVGRSFRTAFAHVTRRMNALLPIPRWLPTPGNRAFARAKGLLDRVVLDMIAARRASRGCPRDLLSLLLAARDEQGGGMTDQQLKDEVLTFLAAGHDTVAAAQTWTWYLLAEHPRVQHDVYDEVRARLQGRSPTAEDLPHLPLTGAVFEEALRLYPPVWGLLRKAGAADEINGFDIPARADIVLCPWLTHRHPDFWDEPERFKPERFLPGQGARRVKFSFFPFGGGPRICIGNTFARMEGALVLATIIQRFRVELVPGHPVVSDPLLRPKYGLRVRGQVPIHPEQFCASTSRTPKRL